VNTSQRQGALFIVMAASGYALLPIIAKFALAEGLTPLDIATWRFLFATPIMWLFVWRLGANPDAARLPRAKLLLMGVFFAGAALQAFFALERISASTFIILVYGYPAFVAIVSMFYGEHLPPIGWGALVLTLVGVALTVPDFASGLGGDPIGIGLSLLNAVTYGLYIVFSSRILRGQTALMHASALSMTGTLLTLVLVTLPIGLNLPTSLFGLGLLVALAIFSTVIPISAVYAGVQRLGAPRAAIIGTVEPVLTMTLSAIFLGEKMLPIQIVGMVLVLSSAILLQVTHRQQTEVPVTLGETV
jgi:drug/metabolite transporter (DMT)-like permease